MKFLLGKAAPLRRHLAAERRKGNLAFAELPYQSAALLPPIRQALRRARRYSSVLVIGIGGSALGARAIASALGGTPVPMRFLDNVDPDAAASALEGLDLRHVLTCVVTKSGATAETLAGFLYFLEECRRRKQPPAPERVCVVTSAMDSELAGLARESGYSLLGISGDVGGRFSALTAAALLPCMAAGVPAAELLRGARRAADSFWKGAPAGNPALAAAILLHDACVRRSKSVQVVMPYADALLAMAAWYAQLWAESLGKERDLEGRRVRAGQTPVVARGASDQHSQLQLYREGPRDKIACIWRLDRFRAQGRMARRHAGLSSFSYLAGRPMAELLDAEAEATAMALARSGCPVLRYGVPAADAFHAGALMYVLECQTVAAAMLWNVNPFDQPGVELGKRAAFALMGREGYEGEMGKLRRRRRA